MQMDPIQNAATTESTSSGGSSFMIKNLHDGKCVAGNPQRLLDRNKSERESTSEHVHGLINSGHMLHTKESNTLVPMDCHEDASSHPTLVIHQQHLEGTHNGTHAIPTCGGKTDGTGVSPGVGNLSRNVVKSLQACPFCSKRMNTDEKMIHLANQHLCDDLARDGIPTEPPFRCPSCPHISPTQVSILKHWLIFHEMLTRYIAGKSHKQLSSPHLETSDHFVKADPLELSSQDSNAQSASRERKNQRKMECLMCDDVRIVGSTPLDLHKHLAEKHFRERLMALIPSIVNTADRKPRFCCPFPGCYYEHHYKWIIAKHYGIKHRIAKQFYDEVIGLEKINCAEQRDIGIDKLIPSSGQYSLENVNRTKATIKGHLNKSKNAKIRQQNADAFNCDSELEDFSSPSLSSCDNSSDESEQIDIDEEMLRRHFADTNRARSSKKRSLLCKICQVKSTSIVKYLKHLSKVHYKQKLMSYITKTSPFKCPWAGCTVVKNDRPSLSLHFGVIHGIALKLLEETPDEAHKTAKCNLCSEGFVNQKQLLSHLSDIHFEEQLNRELPSAYPWKCSKCNHVAGDLKKLRIHFGTKHKKVLDWMQDIKTLKEEVCSADSVLGIQNRGFLPSVDQNHLDRKLIKCPKCDLIVSKYVELVLHVSASHPSLASANNFDQKGFEDENMFPKCQMCDYRYFTRLDLCRHYVDNHLRKQIESCLDPNCLQCPSCLLTYDDHQSCLRHFIWSHQDLEYLVAQNYKVRLSEFPASSKDLKMIIKMKSNRLSPSIASGADIKYLTDLAALPVFKVVTLEENVSCCELCGEEFFDSVCTPRQKGLHLIGHFFNFILKDLKSRTQTDCPKCSFTSNSFMELCEHYGFAHLAIFILMVQELGENWTIDKNYFTQTPIVKTSSDNTFDTIDLKLDIGDKKPLRKRQHSEQDANKTPQGPTRCPICQVILSSTIQFLKHLTEKHFFHQLCLDIPNMECPICGFHGKDQKVLAWHYGISHKKVFSLLNDWCVQNNFKDEDLLTKLSKQEMKPESCPLCQSSFGGHYMLLRHLADCHFREKLSVGYLDGDTYKCPECKHTSKDKGGFIRHLGLVHKWVQKSLSEMGIKLLQDESVVKIKKGRQKTSRSETVEALETVNDFKGPFSTEMHNIIGSSNLETCNKSNFWNPHEKPYFESGQLLGDGSSLPSSSDFCDSPFVSDEIFSSPSYEYSTLDNVQDFFEDRSSQNQILHKDQSEFQDPLLHLNSSSALSISSQNNVYLSSGSSSSSTTTTSNHKIFPYSNQKNIGLGVQQKLENVQNIDQFLVTGHQAPKDAFVLVHYPVNQVQAHGAPTTVEIKEPNVPIVTRSVEIPCTYCPMTFFIKSDFLHHLVENHLQKDFLQDLPKAPPFKCPQYGCAFEADALINLVDHYGVIHKGFNSQQILFENESFSNEKTSDHTVEPQVPSKLPKVVLKLICPLCNQLYGSHMDFYQHLCDFHFKNELQNEVLKTAPSFQCPITGCGFNSMGNAQTLTYHFGISHKVVFHHLKSFLNGTSQLVNASHVEASYSQHLTPSQYELLAQPIKVDLKQIPSVPGSESYTVQDPLFVAQKVSLKTVDQSQFVQSQEKAESRGQNESTTSELKKPSKECEVCGKQFDGKNRAMLKIQHLAHHFKDQLFADLKDKSAPFRCPVEGCTYQTKHKPDWARHYGSVHHFISKYLKEYFEQNRGSRSPALISSSPFQGETSIQKPKDSERGTNNFRISDGERTYSAFLPKDDLNQIISTALSQQSQTGKNFGVVTINPAPTVITPLTPISEECLSFNDQVLPKIEPILESQPVQIPDFKRHNCMICYGWFQNEEALNEHMSQHLQIANQSFLRQEKQKLVEDPPRKMEIDKLINVENKDQGEPLNSVSPSEEIFPSHPTPKYASKSTTGNGLVPNRSTGRPCEICGFEPKTKNKSRERQDHLAMKHYRERIQTDLATTDSYKCPLCEYNGKDKQTIYRHYTGKHKVVEQYLADDIASGKVIPLVVQQQQSQPPQQVHPLPPPTTIVVQAHHQVQIQGKLSPPQIQQSVMETKILPEVSLSQLQAGQFSAPEVNFTECPSQGEIFYQQDVQMSYTEPTSNSLSYVQQLNDIESNIGHAMEDKLLEIHPQTHDQLNHDITNGMIAEDQLPLFDFCVDSQFGLDLSMQSPLPANGRLSMPDFTDMTSDHLIDVDFDKPVDQQLTNTQNLG